MAEYDDNPICIYVFVLLVLSLETTSTRDGFNQASTRFVQRPVEKSVHSRYGNLIDPIVFQFFCFVNKGKRIKIDGKKPAVAVHFDLIGCKYGTSLSTAPSIV